MPLAAHYLVAYLVAALVRSAAAKLVTISNVVPRRDTSGAILDAHDSKLNHRNGLYYWHAASYGNCTEPAGNSGCASVKIGACGFQTDHNVTLYSSADLVTWENRGVAFSATGNLPPQSVLFAPKTVFNVARSEWVMYYNYIVGDFTKSFYGVATSAHPEGPFSVVNTDVKLAFQDNGDEGLFVDDDGSAYIIYTSIAKGHSISIERLSPDYTTSTLVSSGVFGSSNVEAPALFKRGGIYYAVFGACCCYCGSGSVVSVYTAAHVLGPYAKQNTLGELSSQQTDIFSFVDSHGAQQWLYVGDHWQSAPDHLKSHDFTVWAPLTFTADGNVTSPGFLNSFSIDVGP